MKRINKRTPKEEKKAYGSAGGVKRSSLLSAEQRSAIAKKGAAARWGKAPKKPRTK